MEYKNELFILKQIVSLISMYVLLKIAPKKLTLLFVMKTHTVHGLCQ